MYDSNFNPHGFTYSAGVFQVIDFPGALFTLAFGINDGGVIVGLYSDAANFTGVRNIIELEPPDRFQRFVDWLAWGEVSPFLARSRFIMAQSAWPTR